jgi:hypothetical protein
MIETHDRINPGCTKSLYKAIKKIKFKESTDGEKKILIKKP